MGQVVTSSRAVSWHGIIHNSWSHDCIRHGYLLQLRRFGEAADKINSCVQSFISYILQIFLTQYNWRLRRHYARSYLIPHLCATLLIIIAVASRQLHVVLALNERPDLDRTGYNITRRVQPAPSVNSPSLAASLVYRINALRSFVFRRDVQHQPRSQYQRTPSPHRGHHPVCPIPQQS